MPRIPRYDVRNLADRDRLNLRIRLLPQNFYFSRSVADVRRELGIPDNGFPFERVTLEALGGLYIEASELYSWMALHIEENTPRLLPSGPFSYREFISLLEKSEDSFRTRVSTVDPEYDEREIPIMKHGFKLLNSFRLPHSLFQPMVWHFLIGTEIPEAKTTIVERAERWLHDRQYEDDDFGYGVYQYVREGLPEIPGELIVIKMIVNKYTTKKELDRAWQEVKEIRGDGAPNRRPTLPEYWLSWHKARYQEGLSLIRVADRFDFDEEAIRYGIDRIEELMKPENSDL